MLQMVELLKEYVDSGDLNEAMRCLQELDVPHFNHELVYRVFCYYHHSCCITFCLSQL